MTTNEAFFDSQEFRDLLAQYETSVKSGLPIFLDVDDLTDIADYYHFIGDFENAAEAIDYALTLNPGATAPLAYKAREALALDDIELAENYVNQITDTDDPEYQYIRAELLIARGLTEEADRYLRQCFNQVPPEEYQDFVNDVVNIYIDYDKPQKAYEWAMRSRGDDSDEFKEMMAETLRYIGRYEESIQLYNELIDRHPYSKHYWKTLASVQEMSGNYQAALNSIEYAVAIDPNDAESLFSRGAVFRLLKNYEQAIESYRRGIKLDPDVCSSYLQLANCLEELERHDEALETLERALKQTEGSTSQKYVYEYLASIHSKLKQPQKALACLDMAATLDGNDNPIALMILRGDILLANDRFDEAVQTLKQAIIQSDYDTETIMDAGIALYENNYVEAARDLFEKLIAISDDNEDKDLSAEYCYMALCYCDLQQYDEFLKYLQKAVESNPTVAKMVLSHLFPDDIQPEDYYQYMYNKIKNETK